MVDPKIGTQGNADRRLMQLCHEAVKAIEVACDEKPLLRTHVVDSGECAIVRLRDYVIDRLRGTTQPDEARRLRRVLDSANTALSLVVGVEYLGAGIQERPLVQARDLLLALDQEISAS